MIFCLVFCVLPMMVNLKKYGATAKVIKGFNSDIISKIDVGETGQFDDCFFAAPMDIALFELIFSSYPVLLFFM